MTDEPAPHQNGVADDLAALAAVPAAPETATTTLTLTPGGPDTPAAPEPPAGPEPAASEAPAAPPSFDDLGLHPDVKLALDEMGYFAPTPVQTAVYQPVSQGKDLLVQSRTGTGKTTAFGLPIISKLIPTHRAPQALILAPTRELALQVSRELTQIGKHRGILVEPIYGGAPIGKQIRALRDGVHIVVGTPGRVLDHIGRRTLDCSTIQCFVLDECDEMLSMGFLEDIERVVSHLPDRKQTLLFSATMPDEVTRYARRHMRSPEQISLSRDGISVTEIHHAYYIVSGIARSRDLLKILFAENPESAIIFCNTRDETTMVARFLQKQGLDAEPLSSDLAQSDRERVMNRMKQHTLRFLCATDVAARGIDISNLSHVINYSVPESPEIYVHRTGRTGRAGKKGTALSLVGPRELGNFRYVRLQFGIKPEERLLPKDDIFIGKLKVPLPPVGTPQPPDPVQILIRGTPLAAGGPTDLEMKIFEKLLVTMAGKRVVAQLVAERLNQLTTRTKPRRERTERAERPERPERPDRPERDEAVAAPDERGERPREGRDRGERPWRDREDRGERRFDRDRPRSDGERGERTDRPRGDGERGERTDRPRGDGERGERTDRPRGDGERPWRDRDEGRGGRFDRDRDRGRDRMERGDRGDRDERPRERPEAIVEAAAPPVAETAAPMESAAPAGATAAQGTAVREDRERPRDRYRRDRGERRFDRERDREHGERARHEAPARPPEHVEPAAEPVPESTVAVGTEIAPVVETVEVEPAPTRVEEVARAVLDRVEHREHGEHRDRDRDRKGRRDKRSEPTAETREFWETWAEEKSARVTEPRPEDSDTGKVENHRAPAAEAATVPAEAEAEVEVEAADTGEERRGRGRDRGRDRDKGRSRGDTKPDRQDRPGKVDRHDRAERNGKAERNEHPDKADRPSRGKRDTAVTPPQVAAADGAQARLFVSLGKKHGVSADDLRALLSEPIGGDRSRIGSVSLRDSHAHVRVPEEYVDAIIAGVHGTQHNDHDVTVERARA